MILSFNRFADPSKDIIPQMKVGEIIEIGENYYLAIGDKSISKFLRYDNARGRFRASPFGCSVIETFAKRYPQTKFRIFHKEA